MTKSHDCWYSSKKFGKSNFSACLTAVTCSLLLINSIHYFAEIVVIGYLKFWSCKNV
uniref:Uncharacterized protein n=1 Tax=Rhizophora mucronata TaxID=61149 RepID=A0A2P2NSA2_RHIMU